MPKHTKPHTESGSRSDRRNHSSINAHNLVRKVIVLESDDSYTRPWMFEGDRWKELVFALLARTAPHLAGTDIRNLVERMHALRLLDVADLVSVCEGSNRPDHRHQCARLIVELLVENSFTKEEAERGLLTICEAALGLNKHFNGKIQRYLRSYGELMLRESKKWFSFSALSDDDVGYSLTYWLQNVLSMPLPLVDRSWEIVCSEYEVDTAQLITAADDLGVNLALLDDLLRSHLTRRGAEGDQLDDVPVVGEALGDARSSKKAATRPSRSAAV
jgi:hypothetical protein